MKAKTILILISVVISILNATDIYRLTDPTDTYERYGKSKQEGPPFLRFGNIQQYYHYDHGNYSIFTNDVAAVMSKWNNVGIVDFSYSLNQGIHLDAHWDDMSPGGTQLSHVNNIINSSTIIYLSTAYTWSLFGVQDLTHDKFDVQTVLLHEMGHVHGLAHPCTTDYDYDNGDADAPIMAGKDNIYFWGNRARDLRDDDINGTEFLQYNTWVPDQCTTLEAGVPLKLANKILDYLKQDKHES